MTGRTPAAPAAPSTAIVACWDEPRLLQAVAAARRAGRPLVILTDEADRLSPELAAGATVFEPEELISGAVRDFEEPWEEAVPPWLSRVFPGDIDGFSLADILWRNVLAHPSTRDRLQRVALAVGFLDGNRPAEVHVPGAVPTWCELVAAAAEARGVRVHRPILRRARERAWAIGRWPMALAVGPAALAVNLAREALRTRNRRRALASLARAAPGALAAGWGREEAISQTSISLSTKSKRPDPAGAISATPISSTSISSPATGPRLWVVMSGRWRQVSRHLLEAVVAPAEARGVPVGIAFVANFGEGREGGANGEALDEAALFDGRLGRHRPQAIDQVVGAVDVAGVMRVAARVVPPALRSCWGIARYGSALRVAGVPVFDGSQTTALLRIASHHLYHVVDAHLAASAFARRHPDARTAVFGYAPAAESKVVDRVLQRAGVTTVDYLHCYIGEPCIRNDFRSASTHLVTWTREEAARFSRQHTNRYCHGGYLPRDLVARTLHDADRVRILAATNYLHHRPDVAARNAKYARRLAAALVELAEHLGPRAQVVLRPHPEEDRAAWRALLGAGRVAFSDVRDLGDDLARADVAIVTNSSVVIESLAHRIPVLAHASFAVQPDELLGMAAPERRFRDGRELIACVERALGIRDDGPERRLLEACFGPSMRPLPIWSLLTEIDPQLATADAAAS